MVGTGEMTSLFRLLQRRHGGIDRPVPVPLFGMAMVVAFSGNRNHQIMLEESLGGGTSIECGQILGGKLRLAIRRHGGCEVILDGRDAAMKD